MKQSVHRGVQFDVMLHVRRHQVGIVIVVFPRIYVRYDSAHVYYLLLVLPGVPRTVIYES